MMRRNVNRAVALIVTLFVLISAFPTGVFAATHTHDWVYTPASRTEVKATCANSASCPTPEVSLTLSAPADLTYNGSPKAVVINNKQEGMSFSATYYDESAGGIYLGSVAPSKVGKYSVDVIFGSAGSLSLNYEITTATITAAAVSSTLSQIPAPVATKTPLAVLPNGVGYQASIVWEPADATFAYNTAYKATVVLTALDGYVFDPAITVSGWDKAGNDTALTLTKTYDATSREIATKVTPPTYAAKFTYRYANAAEAIAVLPTHATVEVNGRTELAPIVWSCNYNTADNFVNAFTWSVEKFITDHGYTTTAGLALGGVLNIENADPAISLEGGVSNSTVFVEYGKTWADADFSKVIVRSHLNGGMVVPGTWEFVDVTLTDTPTAEGTYEAIFTPNDTATYSILRHRLEVQFSKAMPDVTITLDKAANSYHPTDTVTVTVSAVNANKPEWLVPENLISISYQISGGEKTILTGNSFIIPPDADGKTITISVYVAPYLHQYSDLTVPLTFTVNSRAAVNNQAVNKTIPYQTSYDVTSLFTLDPNAGASTYTLVDDGGIASLDPATNILTISGLGTVKVRLDTAATGTHLSDSDIAELTIEKGLGSVTVRINGWDYNATPNAPVVSTSTHADVIGQATIRYTGTANDGTPWDSDQAPQKAGDYTVTVTVPANTLYQACTNSAPFKIATIDPALGTITATAPIYKSSIPAKVVLTHDGTLAGTFSLTHVTAFTVGTQEYDYTFTPDDLYNYNVYTGKVSLTVLPDAIQALEISGTLTNTVYTHGDTLDPTGLTFKITYLSGEKATVPASDPALILPVLQAGQTTATVRYGDASDTVDGFTVTKATATVSGISADSGATYNGQPQVGYTGTPTCGSYTGSYDFSYVGRGATTYGPSATAPTDAGDYTVTISIPDSEPNYQGSTSLDFTVGKATVTITVNSITAYIGHTLPTLTYSITGLCGNDTLIASPTIDSSAVNMSVGGVYTVSASGADAGSNYTVTYVDGTVTVTRAQGSGSISIQGWTYGDTPNAPVITSSTYDISTVILVYEGTANDGSSYSSNQPPVNAGDYTVTATFPDTTAYAEYTTAPVSFTIAKKMPSYSTPSGFSANFGDYLSQFSLPVGYAWQDGSGTTVGDAGTNSFPVVFTPSDIYNYETVTGIQVTITVAKLDISNQSLNVISNLTYNGKEQSCSFSLGTINGQTVTYSATGDRATDVGSYTLTVTGTGNFTGTLSADWSITALQITNKNIEVTLGKELVYTGAEQIQTVKSVKVGDLDVDYTITAGDRATNVGIYNMTIRAEGNFSGTVKVRWTIAPDTSKIDHLTVDNVTSADEDDIREVLDSIQSAEAKKEWKDVVDKCEDLLDAIANASRTLHDVLDALNRYTIETVKSSNKATIERLEKEIDELLTLTNLTEDERDALETGADKADALLDRIADVAEQMADITNRLSKYDINTVKSTDKADIQDILADVEKLLAGDNLTPSERVKMLDAKILCEKLLERIQDAYDQANTDSIDKAGNLTEDNLTGDDRETIEQAIKDLTDAKDLYPGNYTDGESQEIDDELARLQELLEKAKELEDRARLEDAINELIDLLAKYTIETVKSSDKTDIEGIKADIQDMLKQSGLTSDDRNVLQNGVTKATALLNRIAEVAAQMEYIHAALDSFSIDTIKSPDKARIENILTDIQALLDGQNLTPAERADMEDAKAFANSLLQRIQDAYNQANTENVVSAGEINAENVKPDNRSLLQSALKDLTDAISLYPGNYTDGERKAIDDEILRITALLAQLDKIAAVQDKIDNLPENANPGDQSAQDAYKDAKDSYDDLTDHEKTQVDTDKLDGLAGLLGTYMIIEGADGKWLGDRDEGLTFVANGALDQFAEILVDGVTVKADRYTAKAPLTTVEISPEYLETLDDGEHTLTVRYDDGEASCKFTTESAGASWLWLLVLLLILLAIVGSGLMFFFIYKKKEEKNVPVNPA